MLAPTVTTPEPLTELVRRAANDDREAEAELCRRFTPAVRAFARRRLIGSDAVDEFAQDVLLVFIEALRSDRIDEPEQLGGFVLGICRNLALGRVRQRERRASLWERFGGAFASFSVPVSPELPYAVALLEDCLSQMSHRAREVVRLGYLEAKSHADVARELEISEANARVLRHRTLESLRECMGGRISWEAT